ncbi:hypothetical protein Hdeb2414_s0004g00120371 [Helianthus debilis subsp. tardiflorus]
MFYIDIECIDIVLSCVDSSFYISMYVVICIVCRCITSAGLGINTRRCLCFT